MFCPYNFEDETEDSIIRVLKEFAADNMLQQMMDMLREPDPTKTYPLHVK
jgi:hypothetical protein